jgi:hypothetical protein
LINAQIDPTPGTAAAQGRVFFYEAQKEDLSMKSKDFDYVYDQSG